VNKTYANVHVYEFTNVNGDPIPLG
jgi:hypothetical protein